MGSLLATDLPLQYPAAGRDDSVVDDNHGVRIVDPYRCSSNQHRIFLFLVGTLCSLMQTKYQAANASSPFDTHYNLVLLFIAALFLYAAAYISEIEFHARDSTYHTLTIYTRLIACAISLEALLFILDLTILGWIVFSLWACFSVKKAHHFRLHFYNFLQTTRASVVSIWNNLVESVNTPVTKLQPPPSQPLAIHTIVITGSSNLSM